MKRHLKLSLLIPTVVGAFCASSHGQILTSLTAPTPGASDAYFLPGNTNSIKNGANGTAISNSDSQTYVSYDQTAKGQAFTTGSNALGYSLNSFTLQQVQYADNNTYSNAPAGSTFNIEIGQISASTGLKTGTLTSATFTVNAGSGTAGLPDTSGGKYFTFDLSSLSITLLPGTQYYFEVASTRTATATGNYFFELNSRNTSSGGSIAGAFAFQSNAVNATSVDGGVNVETGDFAFDASLTAIVPEPGTTATMLLGAAGLLLVIRRRRAPADIAR